MLGIYFYMFLHMLQQFDISCRELMERKKLVEAPVKESNFLNAMNQI